MSKKRSSSKKTSRSMKGIAIIPVIIIIGLGLFGVLVGPKLLKKTNTSKTTTAGQTSQPDADGWQTYRHAQYGYSIRHPKGWSVDDSKFPSTQEILVVDSEKNGIVKINSYQDKTITSEESVMSAIAAFKQKMSSDPDIKVLMFKDSFEDRVGGFISQGEQTINEEKFLFINKGLVSTNNRILIFHGATKATVAQQYGDTTAKIIESFALDKNE